MTTDDRQDDEALKRLVRRFRRVARLAGIDPSRMLATDPLARLEALAAPTAALIDVTPSERLREVLAPDAAVGSGSPLRRRLEPLAQISRSPRPPELQAFSHQRAGVGTAQTVTLHRAARHASGSTADDYRMPQREPGATTVPAATLAQRRAELRRLLAGQGAASALPFSSRIVTSTGHNGSLPPVRSATGTPSPGERAGNVAQLPLQTRLHNTAAGTWPIGDSVRPPAPMSEISDRESDGAAVAGITGGVAHTDDTAIPMAASDRLPRAPSATIAAIPQRPQAGPPADLAVRRIRADTPVGTAARPPRSWDGTAGLDITDDLFEALYRNGVDVSWP